MITHSDVAALSHAVYGGRDSFVDAVAAIDPKYRWCAFMPSAGFGICYGAVTFIDENVVIFRGTEPTMWQNWFQDLMAYPAPYPHSTFGPMHLGSICGMDKAMAAIVKSLDLSLPTTFGGHSLGGQRADEAAGIFLEQFQPKAELIRRVLIAPPAAGTQLFLDYTKDIETVAYRNGGSLIGDPVPLLPFKLVGFEYVGHPHIHITVPPKLVFDPVAWHNSELYMRGIGV